MAKRTILLTGASGSMGSEAFHELLRHSFMGIETIRVGQKDRSQNIIP